MNSYRSHTHRFLTWPEWRQQAHRRERRLRYGIAFAALVLPATVAYVVIGVMGCGL